MAYEPTIWKDGDVISAEKLNKIENAVDNVLFININTSPLSVTWQDIYDACQSQKIVIGYGISDPSDNEEAFEYILLSRISHMNETDYYIVSFSGLNFSSNSPTGELQPDGGEA